MPKQFRVVAISSNRGAFGHNEAVLFAPDGEAWKVLHIQDAAHGVWMKNDTITLERYGDSYNWAASYVERPLRAPRPSRELLRQVFGDSPE